MTASRYNCQNGAGSVVSAARIKATAIMEKKNDDGYSPNFRIMHVRRNRRDRHSSRVINIKINNFEKKDCCGHTGSGHVMVTR